MTDFRFAAPLALLLLLLLPLVLEDTWRARLPKFGRKRNSEQEPSLRFSSPVSLAALPTPLRLRLRVPVINLLRIACYCLLVIALARPQTGSGLLASESGGRDILLALDTSGSMEAMDFFVDGTRTSRLAALQAIVKEFIEARKGDRVGLVVFGDEVFTLSPLTQDRWVLNDFIDGLEVGMAGKGTALGDAIAVGLKRIKDIETDSRVLVLVTDGMRTAGQIDPQQAASIAAGLGVKIHTIGIGGKAPAPFPAVNIFGIQTLEYREVPLDEETLERIAVITGGQYFHAEETAELRQVYAAIDKLEQRMEETFDYTDYEELFMPFVVLGMLLFVTAELLGRTVLATIP